MASICLHAKHVRLKVMPEGILVTFDTGDGLSKRRRCIRKSHPRKIFWGFLETKYSLRGPISVQLSCRTVVALLLVEVTTRLLRVRKSSFTFQILLLGVFPGPASRMPLFGNLCSGGVEGSVKQDTLHAFPIMPHGEIESLFVLINREVPTQDLADFADHNVLREA